MLSASEDTTVCHWCVPLAPHDLRSLSPDSSLLRSRDIRGYTKGNSSMDPLNVYRGHSAIVEDVAWHNLQEDVFASVGDDRMLLLCVFPDYLFSPTAVPTLASSQVGHARAVGEQQADGAGAGARGRGQRRCVRAAQREHSHHGLGGQGVSLATPGCTQCTEN